MRVRLAALGALAVTVAAGVTAATGPAAAAVDDGGGKQARTSAGCGLAQAWLAQLGPDDAGQRLWSAGWPGDGVDGADSAVGDGRLSAGRSSGGGFVPDPFGDLREQAVVNGRQMTSHASASGSLDAGADEGGCSLVARAGAQSVQLTVPVAAPGGDPWATGPDSSVEVRLVRLSVTAKARAGRRTDLAVAYDSGQVFYGGVKVADLPAHPTPGQRIRIPADTRQPEAATVIIDDQHFAGGTSASQAGGTVDAVRVVTPGLDGQEAVLGHAHVALTQNTSAQLP